MSTQKEQILEKIAKLISKSKSSEEIGSIQEAEAFMSKARQLLLEYNLSEDDIKTKNDDYIRELLNYGEIVSLTSNDGIRWLQDLINIICIYNLTKYVHLNRTNSCYIVGTQVNIDFTKSLINTMVPVFLNLCSKRWSEHSRQMKSGLVFPIKKNKFRRDYLDGVVIGVNKNYSEEKRAQEALEKAQLAENKRFLEEGPITALVRTNEVILKQKTQEMFNDLRRMTQRVKKVTEVLDIGIKDGQAYKKDKIIE